jgi:hypothetical protein
MEKHSLGLTEVNIKYSIFHIGYNPSMEWGVEFTDEFGDWWNGLSAEEQEDVRAYVKLLQEDGPNLKFPYSSGVVQSAHDHMRELRVQHDGRPYRVLYAFDPRRTAMLLIGGDKPGMIAGTTFSSRLPTVCTMPTSLN